MRTKCGKCYQNSRSFSKLLCTRHDKDLHECQWDLWLRSLKFIWIHLQQFKIMNPLPIYYLKYYLNWLKLTPMSDLAIFYATKRWINQLFCFSLQQSLTELQQQQLDQLHDWLTAMERHIQLVEATATTTDSIQQQIVNHKACYSTWKVFCVRVSYRLSLLLWTCFKDG